MSQEPTVDQSLEQSEPTGELVTPQTPPTEAPADAIAETGENAPTQ